MNKCKPVPGGYKRGQRPKGQQTNQPEPIEGTEYTVHLPVGHNLRLPGYDGPEYGPVTVTDGSGATIRVIGVAELGQRGQVRQGARPVLQGRQRYIASDSIIKRL